ncbi:MAG: hypothetical protein WCV68_00895 [Candidatus Paceibacterota bacterium]|jgi:hypothetical protein
MDKKSKILLGILALVIFISVGISFYQTIYIHKYLITTEISCDPNKESCFVFECDPVEDESCSKDPNQQVSYYKIISKNAQNIPICESGNDNCPELSCIYGEKDCQITLCAPDEGEGIICSDNKI